MSKERKRVELEDNEKEQYALRINEGLRGSDLHRGMVEPVAGQNTPFRISPEPFWIDEQLLQDLQRLGPQLLSFYQAANRLYIHSVRGSQPEWVRAYLEAGKSETVVDYQRMRRFRTQVPAIIRPDVIPTDDGFILAELDSVPGGFGLLGALSRQYEALGFDLVGGTDGIVDGFWRAVAGMSDQPDPTMAIVVSDESEDYRGEMRWMAEALRSKGYRAYESHPKDLTFDEEGLYVGEETSKTPLKIDVLYRFFELFDLKNIPKIDLLLYAIRKEMIRATPPIKSNLEEKLLMALLHHPTLAPFWRQHMPKEVYDRCLEVFPKSWIVDPAPLPPHAVIPDLTIGGVPVNDWHQLKGASQRERELVLKPSGYSPDAWGSRGVRIGHDLSAEEWGQGVEEALSAFSSTPHVLQQFHKGRQFRVRYYDFDEGRVKTMSARARLCPYYFVIGDDVQLGGILATATPLDKKAIHGMSDAVMAPVAVQTSL